MRRDPVVRVHDVGAADRCCRAHHARLHAENPGEQGFLGEGHTGRVMRCADDAHPVDGLSRESFILRLGQHDHVVAPGGLCTRERLDVAS